MAINKEYIKGYFEIINSLFFKNKNITEKNMTEKEKEEQRRSFVYGNLKTDHPDITRELIDKIADEMMIENILK